MATENIASVPARWPFLPRAADPDQADRPAGWVARKRSIDLASASTSSVTVSGIPADAGETRANSSLS